MTEDSRSRTTDGERTNDAADPAIAPGMTRRRALRSGSLLGATALLGSTGAAAASAASGCNRPTEEIHLDYDDYDSWDDVYWRSNGDPDNATLVASPTYSGERALQMRIRDGQSWGVSTHYDLDDGVFELDGRVHFALDTGWEMPGRDPSNCRLWNCAMALGEGSAGGGVPDGTNGWSNRLYVTTSGGEADGPFRLLSHTYHMDESQDHDYLLDGEEYVVNEAEIVPGRWYEFGYYVCVNTVTNGRANADGVVQYRLDGDLVYDRRDVRFTADLEDNVIETTGPAGYYGGRYVSPKNLYAYYDHHSMALDGTFGDGC
ncbi:hypothetical protein [Natrarchaeobius oligotrophus]|uniref:Uncharacterized protein n=1 Tax=Natrarchaeobius chitinivorans TaxID=1679083 RepID=A0A3N6PKQ1_NATCH|nr:hypothetical protein [Natrarchaeobius chitinivorans]RQG99375.1 hypothetical protein EA472_14200 [Natrarchaeobius chitinivorans]